jgi:arsenate reductase
MKKILFVCIENSCRSQMAEGWARFLGAGSVEPYSAGSKPPEEVNPAAIEVMKEAGIDISSNKPKGFTDLPVKKFDYVITMGCGDICPFVPADKHINWKIDDPKGKDMDFFRKVRDSIKNRVVNLIKEG